jgi:uncharacterized protein
VQFPNGKILVFCKAPEDGKVKTRLAKDIGDQAAVALHKHLTLFCLQQLRTFDVAPIELWCAPNTEHEFFLECGSRFDISLKQQVGHDLGQRMQHALTKSLEHHSPVVLVGTDCPLFSAEYFYSAFIAASQNKTVIGPAEDGGYVLLGTQKVQADIFTDMPWGSDQVYPQTMVRLTGEVELLSRLWDIDYLSDLKRLCALADRLMIDAGFRDFLQDSKFTLSN